MMEQAVLIYCYDAYCGWCYGFSPVIRRIAEEYKNVVHAEVLSGGMILPAKPTHISTMASYIRQAYRTVEQSTGITFGEDYLWHIVNEDESDWYPDSLKPAIAMCIFKELFPMLQVEFAADLQFSHHYEGRDLTDEESYRHLLERYAVNAEQFYSKMKMKEYEEKARYEFALVKQLKVTGFPTVLMQVSESKFYMVARGFTRYETLRTNIDTVLHSITKDPSSSS
jgi:putative protein-disulfide isomerase